MSNTINPAMFIAGLIDRKSIAEEPPVLTRLIALMMLPFSAFADVDGSADHPMISRYPDSTIEWYQVENHRDYFVPTGPVTGYRHIDQGELVAGRVTRIYYALDGGDRSDREVYQNYLDGLSTAGMEILAQGYEPAGGRSAGVGSRKWRQVLFLNNAWNDSGAAVNDMVSGSSTSGGGGSIVARKERAAGTAYVVVTVYRFREDRVATLVDVVEVKAAESGLVIVDAEAIGAGIEEKGRVVLEGLFFDYDKASLTAASDPALKEIAVFLKANPDKRFYVVGHTDAKGTFSYNYGLSGDRARAVVKAMTKRFEVDAARLEAHGVGPLVPVFSNDSDAGRERNRRVELVERLAE